MLRSQNVPTIWKLCWGNKNLYLPLSYDMYICENTTFSSRLSSVRLRLFSSFPDGWHYQQVAVEEDSCDNEEEPGQLEPKLIFE